MQARTATFGLMPRAWAALKPWDWCHGSSLHGSQQPQHALALVRSALVKRRDRAASSGVAVAGSPGQARVAAAVEPSVLVRALCL